MNDLSDFFLIFAVSTHSGWRNIEESYQALARQRIWKIQSSRAKSGGRSSCVGISGANLYLGPYYTFTGESRFFILYATGIPALGDEGDAFEAQAEKEPSDEECQEAHTLCA